MLIEWVHDIVGMGIMKKQMLAHYYDYQMTRVLDCHLALVGFFGADQDRVGYSISALTGLPFIDLMRLIEHQAGQSIAELILRQGEIALRRLESICLSQALKERPCGVLSLGDGTLIDEQQRQRVLQQTRLVYLQMDLPQLYWKLRHDLTQAKSRHFPFLTNPPQHPDDLMALFDVREPGYRAAQIIYPVSGGQPWRIALDLIRKLHLN